MMPSIFMLALGHILRPLITERRAARRGTGRKGSFCYPTLLLNNNQEQSSASVHNEKTHRICLLEVSPPRPPSPPRSTSFPSAGRGGQRRADRGSRDRRHPQPPQRLPRVRPPHRSRPRFFRRATAATTRWKRIAPASFSFAPCPPAHRSRPRFLPQGGDGNDSCKKDGVYYNGAFDDCEVGLP